MLRERIIETATNLFFRSGIRAITMDSISREIGISKRTVYENFKDKDELLRNCLMHMDALHVEETDKLIAESENTIDLMFRFLEHGIRAIEKVNPLFVTDLRKYHYRIWKETYSINYQKYLDQSYTLIKKGINEGWFRKEVNIEIVSVLLNAQLRIMSDEEVFPSGRFPKTTVFEHIVITFLRGIATQKGLDMIERYIPAAEADK